MDPNTFPTKGNLILAKNSLKLAHMGYELMDKKRNILIRELMGLIDEAKDIQRQIDVTFREAYAALQIANMEIGITNVQTVSYTVPVEESIRIKTRSIMGVEIPLVEADPSGQAPTYAYYSTKESLDQARQAFEKVKDLTLNLSMIENSAYRLAAENTEACQRAEEHHDSALHPAVQGYRGRTGGEGARGVHTTEGHQTEKEQGKLIRLSRNRDAKPAWAAKRFAVPGGFLCVVQKICFWLHFLCKNFIKIFYLFKTVFAIIRKAIVKKS